MNGPIAAAMYGLWANDEVELKEFANTVCVVAEEVGTPAWDAALDALERDTVLATWDAGYCPSGPEWEMWVESVVLTTSYTGEHPTQLAHARISILGAKNLVED